MSAELLLSEVPLDLDDLLYQSLMKLIVWFQGVAEIMILLSYCFLGTKLLFGKHQKNSCRSVSYLFYC